MFGKKNGEAAVRQELPEVYPRLWRFCLVLTKDRSSADDLAQMTCLQGLRKAEQFQPGTHLDRWLFTIARRLWLNQLRDNKSHQQTSDTVVDLTLVADEKPSPETNMFVRDVFTLVQDLPEGQRLAVLLVYVEGYSYREAASAMEVPVGTIMSRLAAARQKISDQVNLTRVAE